MHSPTIVAVGMFDGVHKGHRYMLDRLVQLGVSEGLEPAVVTFANHPRSVTSPDRIPRLLTDCETRSALISGCGVNDILILDFTESLRRLSAAEFAQTFLIAKLNAKAVLLGHDNGFGSDRLRSVEDYRRVLAPMGISVYECDVLPGLAVSSTDIRNALQSGNLRLANRMLGRPYAVTGKAVRGKHLGSSIGFPTANLDTANFMLPKPGVYAGRIIAPAQFSGLPAMVNIGTAPTVNGNRPDILVEVHIIDECGESFGDLYGQYFTIEFIERLRDEKRFDTLDGLVHALSSDRAHTLEIFAKIN